MLIFTVSLLAFLAGSTIFVLFWLLLKEKQRTTELLAAQGEHFNASDLRQSRIIEQAFAQLRAADPWQYQTIMSMNGTPLYDGVYDPSEQAEAARIAERDSKQEDLEESLSAEESAVLEDLFPGYQR